TADNGKTFEEGDYFDIYNQPLGPGEKFRVQVFKWTEDGEPFVGWMERMSPDAREQYKQSQAAGAGDPMMLVGPEDVMRGMFVAKPPQSGEPRWIPANSPEGSEIMQTPIQNGQRAIPRS